MRPTERLTERLETLNFHVYALDWAKGYWSHRTQDVCRWEATGRFGDGPLVNVSSWDSITACARLGIELSKDRGGQWWADAIRKPKAAQE